MPKPSRVYQLCRGCAAQACRVQACSVALVVFAAVLAEDAAIQSVAAQTTSEGTSTPNLAATDRIGGGDEGKPDAFVTPDSKLSKLLKGKLEKIRAKFGLPALWAARYQVTKPQGEAFFIAATGLRKSGAESPASVDDPVHLGSCTKAITALMIAQAVSAGEIEWTDTLGRLLPTHDGINESKWSDVTVLELMQQRSGCATTTPWHIFHQVHPDDVLAARRAMVDWLLEQDRPANPKFEYSNLNYALLGHILEVAHGETWETLIAKRIFEPLGIERFGFGPVSKPDVVSQASQDTDETSDQKAASVHAPWGHVVDASIGKLLGRAIASAASGGATIHDHSPVEIDNVPPLGPAGRLHMPMTQWCKLLKLFIDEQAPEQLLGVKQADWDMLTATAPDENYAGGWIILDREWAGGKTLMHNGSNTTWYCVAWMGPKNDVINVAATNCYDPNVQKACDKAIGALFEVAEAAKKQED